MNVVQEQYVWVQGAREAMLQYLNTVHPEHFVQELPAFGDRSIRFQCVHTINTYQFWIGEIGLQQEPVYLKPELYKDITMLAAAYQMVDTLILEFEQQYGNALQSSLSRIIKSRNLPIVVSPLKLFTHVITHEFHHKGQILSMSRQLGYTPPDTDVIRF